MRTNVTYQFPDSYKLLTSCLETQTGDFFYKQLIAAQVDQNEASYYSMRTEHDIRKHHLHYYK